MKKNCIIISIFTIVLFFSCQNKKQEIAEYLAKKDSCKIEESLFLLEKLIQKSPTDTFLLIEKVELLGLRKPVPKCQILHLCDSILSIYGDIDKVIFFKLCNLDYGCRKSKYVSAIKKETFKSMNIVDSTKGDSIPLKDIKSYAPMPIPKPEPYPTNEEALAIALEKYEILKRIKSHTNTRTIIISKIRELHHIGYYDNKKEYQNMVNKEMTSLLNIEIDKLPVDSIDKLSLFWIKAEYYYHIKKYEKVSEYFEKAKLFKPKSPVVLRYLYDNKCNYRPYTNIDTISNNTLFFFDKMYENYKKNKIIDELFW